jgi:hypothetical protein
MNIAVFIGGLARAGNIGFALTPAKHGGFVTVAAKGLRG